MDDAIKRLLHAAMLAAVLMPLTVRATTPVIVRVTIVEPPPCTINDDRPIEVDFGDVMTTRVDGSNYLKPIEYTLNCTNLKNNAMKLQLKGVSASFDGKLLKTTKQGLGIGLLQGSSKMSINSWLNFTYPNKPELWAVPVQQGGVTLSGGEFTAGATMSVAYQ
ncbi:fimbrial protein [Serratia fonticola]|uniref:fimbrial protein n=1 Tax=Serratia fonticola TaxID=47917 RepID=UPI0034C5E55C